MRSEVGEVGTVFVAEWTEWSGGLGHDGVDVLRQKVHGHLALAAVESVPVQGLHAADISSHLLMLWPLLD